MFRATAICLLASLLLLASTVPAAAQVHLSRKSALGLAGNPVLAAPAPPMQDMALAQIQNDCSMSGCTAFALGLTVTILDASTNASKEQAA
ncbi:MAG: hypothetical protein WDW36_003977 [Sanguina aurantia]